MDHNQKEHLKSVLLQQKAALLNRSSSYVEEQKVVEIRGDEMDWAQTASQAHISLRLQERERFLVQKIDKALSKLEEGTFGLCQECGEAMSFQRLLARPVATLCIGCKEEQENKERFYA